MTSVSVVIPCFNSRTWISETLRSVLLQDASDVEVIVVDDGSTDGSGDLVAVGFPSVRLSCTEDAGPSGARNVGGQHAHGEFIQYLDADDLQAAGKLMLQMRALEKGGADIAYGDWRELKTRDGGTWAAGRVV